jgi:hypothetical protein
MALPALAALGFASGAIGAFGSIYQGKMERAAREYNARLAERNASAVIEQSIREEKLVRIAGKKALGDIEADYAASGVAPSYDVLAESAFNVEMDAMSTRYAGELQASNLKAEAVLSRFYGKAAQTASYFSAASQLLGGASAGYRFMDLGGGGSPSASSPSMDDSLSYNYSKSDRLSRTA